MTTESSNGTGTVFTVKDWAKLVYEELKELKDKFAMCFADTRQIPELKHDVDELTKAVSKLSDDLLVIQTKAAAAAGQRALWVSIVTGGAVAGVIELIVQLMIR